jgi:four helix bundle protein
MDQEQQSADVQMVRSYQQLKVWQLGMDLVVDVYRTTTGLPKSEQFGFASQMQRAAVSVPSNIAEGHARDSTKEFLHHISIALGSLAELEAHLLLAQRLSYITADTLQPLLVRTAELGRMCRGLQKSLKSKL